MSYHCWTVDGFGFCVDDIHTDGRSLMWLIGTNNELMSRIREAVDEELTADNIMEVIGDFESDEGIVGLAAVLQFLLKDEHNLYFCCCADFDGRVYLLFEPRYPWALGTAEERNLTEEYLRELLQAYIRTLTDQELLIYYYSVENGG